MEGLDPTPTTNITQDNVPSPTSSPFLSQQQSQIMGSQGIDSQPATQVVKNSAKIKDEMEEDDDQALQSQDPVELCCIEGCHRVHSNHVYSEKAGILRAGPNSMKMCRTHYIEGLGSCCVKDCTVKATNRNWKVGMAALFTLKKEFTNKPKSKLKVCTDHNSQYSAFVSLSKDKTKKRKNTAKPMEEKKKQRKVATEELDFINRTLSTWNESSSSDSDSSSSDSDSSDSILDGSSGSSSPSSSDSEEEEEEKKDEDKVALQKQQQQQRPKVQEQDDQFMDEFVRVRSSTTVVQPPTSVTPDRSPLNDSDGGMANGVVGVVDVTRKAENGNNGTTVVPTTLPRAKQVGGEREKAQKTAMRRKRKRASSPPVTRGGNAGGIGGLTGGSVQEEIAGLRKEIGDMRAQMSDMQQQLKRDLSEKLEALKNEFLPLIKLQLEQAHQREMIQLNLLSQKYSAGGGAAEQKGNT